MKIVQISVGQAVQNGQSSPVVMGLGDDQKVYFWNAGLAGWQKNWQQQPAPAEIVKTSAEKPAKVKKRA